MNLPDYTNISFPESFGNRISGFFRSGAFLRVVFIVFILAFTFHNSPAQVSTFNKMYVDTLKQGRPTGNMYLGFYFLEDAMQYLYLSATASGLILDSRNLYELSGVIYYQGLKERSTSNNGYIYFHTNLFRHKFTEGKAVLNKFSLEPFALFQFDEDRGINARWQTGVYMTPVFLNHKKLRIQAGFGFLYQWDRYDLLPPDYVGWWTDDQWKVVQKDISSLDPDSNGFVNRSGLRAAMYLGLSGSFGKVFDMNVILFYQQPFKSNFKGTELWDVSADFRTPYPCLSAEMIMNFKILSWLAMDLRYYMQHDRNQLTFYLPYYMYTVTMGVSFTI